jgi:hypothetical protein
VSDCLAHPETALFTALPRLCISSPIPRTVAQPAKAKINEKNAKRRNVLPFKFFPQAQSLARLNPVGNESPKDAKHEAEIG